ncbi:iron ABC transporter permease [Svornostia abyssi]|uniref:Iron ABC transporter permease n=1 Tax=Svornostia abyssi TaxID=2898438 RepID=A0ABY5PIN1_9ACTN|nr:iron ABC transporter permease [Parviterribacteraceae bacterium J379]
MAVASPPVRPARRFARQGAVLACATFALVASVAASMSLGAVDVPLGTVIDALRGTAEEGPLKEIVTQLRLPRTVSAIFVGAGLGVAGALLQGALANPLASPDVIGVTGGSAFGAMLVLLAFPGSIALLPVGALAFGLLASAIVFGIAWTGVNRGGIQRLILAGIAISALFGAGTMTLMTAYPDRVQSAVFWMAGGITTTGWEDMRAVWPYFAAGFAITLAMPRALDRLSLGDDVAASLGSRPAVIRLVAGLAAALLAASAAAIAGLLTFIGLVIPHLVRMAGGTSRHGFVIPASAVAGAALLVTGDTLARVILAPRELPVGPFMVVLGVPLFLWLLRRQ